MMTEPQDETIKLELPSGYQYLSVISDALKTMLKKVPEVEAQTCYNIQLAVQEACTNIVDHAHKGNPDLMILVVISLRLTVDSPRCIVVELVDHGVTFDITHPPAVDLNNPRIRGYGLLIIHQLMDEVHYQTASDGNHWRLIKYL